MKVCSGGCISNSEKKLDFGLSSFTASGYKMQKIFFLTDFIDILIFSYEFDKKI